MYISPRSKQYERHAKLYSATDIMRCLRKGVSLKNKTEFTVVIPKTNMSISQSSVNLWRRHFGVLFDPLIIDFGRTQDITIELEILQEHGFEVIDCGYLPGEKFALTFSNSRDVVLFKLFHPGSI